jgi:hypothetical protein
MKLLLRLKDLVLHKGYFEAIEIKRFYKNLEQLISRDYFVQRLLDLIEHKEQ